MKLSTIWYKASKELTQIRGDLGDRDKKTACAYGAIFYYDAKDKSFTRLVDYDLTLMRQSKTLIPAVSKFQIETGEGILTLNDHNKWTFLQFARQARKLGL